MKKKKPILQYVLFLIICILFYILFRDSLSDIWSEVCKTKGTVLLAISLAAILYHIFEGHITYLLAVRHQKDYTFWKGIKNSFFASFYRVATLGSAGGLSAIYNLHLDNVPVSDGVGLYFVGYVLHKIAILLYGVIVLILRASWIGKNFSEYDWYFVLGYALGILIVIGMVLICVSPLIYRIANLLLEKLKKKLPKKAEKIDELNSKLQAMQKETRLLLRDWKLIVRVILEDLVKLSTYFIIPYLILYSSHVISPWDSLSLVAIIYILAAAIPTPSGVGSIEAVYLLLSIKFMSSVEAAASMLLFRFATMIIPFAIGGIYIMIRNFLLLYHSKHCHSE